jgi:catechol 2,3-dioxygenase-like lactoylglutathione lyase family enzyme
MTTPPVTRPWSRPPVPPISLSHVALNTDDLDRLHRFYVDVVGLELRSLSVAVGAAYTRVAAFGSVGDDLLLVYEVPGFRPAGSLHRGGSFDHLALAVSDPAQLAALGERLAAAGRSSGRPVDRGGRKTVRFTDPDGVEAVAVCGPPPPSP